MSRQQKIEEAVKRLPQIEVELDRIVEMLAKAYDSLPLEHRDRGVLDHHGFRLSRCLIWIRQAHNDLARVMETQACELADESKLTRLEVEII